MPFNKFEMTLTLDAQAHFPEELHVLTNALDVIAKNPNLLQRLLRQAVAETWLVAYRQKFLDDLPEAMTMERADNKAPTAAYGALVDAAKDAMTKASEALTDAQLEGRHTSLAQRRVDNATAAYHAAIEHDNPLPDSARIPHGDFRNDALNLLRQMSEIVMSTSGEPTVGVGFLPDLDKIKTPSATPRLSENTKRGTHESDSQWQIFWEHLEFGTGALAKGKKSDVRGPWRFGPGDGGGIWLKGSPGVHALYDTGGVPYAPASFRFEEVFEAYFAQVLRGQFAA